MIGATLNRLPSKEEETRRTPTNAPSSRRVVPMRYRYTYYYVGKIFSWTWWWAPFLAAGSGAFSGIALAHTLLDDGSSGPSSSS